MPQPAPTPAYLLSCPERVRLGNKVVAAIQEVYRLRAEPEYSETGAAGELRNARKMQRDAEKVLNEHFEQHGCK